MGMDLISAVLVADADENRKAQLDWDAGFKYIESASADDLSWVDMDGMMYCPIETEDDNDEVPTEESIQNLRDVYKYALTDVRDTIEGWGRSLNVYTMFGKNFYFLACESWGDVDEVIDSASIVQFSNGLMETVGFYTNFHPVQT